jgi:hypothetical protein
LWIIAAKLVGSGFATALGLLIFSLQYDTWKRDGWPWDSRYDIGCLAWLVFGLMFELTCVALAVGVFFIH